MRDIEELFQALGRSEFRSRMRLVDHDAQKLVELGRSRTLSDARDFVRQRLAPAAPANDGRQTPMRGHPVFVAQHATGTCCRLCLSRWHGIPTGRELSGDEMDYILSVIDHWLGTQVEPVMASATQDTAGKSSSVRAREEDAAEAVATSRSAPLDDAAEEDELPVQRMLF